MSKKKKLKRKLEKKIMRKVSKLAKTSIKALFSELYGNRSVLCEPIVTGPYTPLPVESESHDNEDQSVLSTTDEF